MKREDYYDQQHKKQLPTFKELSKKILSRVLKLIDIRVDQEQFGHIRVTIFLHEEE